MGLFDFFKNNVKIGDSVICIDDRDWNGATNINLVYNKKYKVIDIIKTKTGKCYDVGGRFIDNTAHTIDDDDTFLPGKGIHWARSARFRKLNDSDELRSKEELASDLETALINEDYLTAKTITEKLEKIKDE